MGEQIIRGEIMFLLVALLVEQAQLLCPCGAGHGNDIGGSLDFAAANGALLLNQV